MRRTPLRAAAVTIGGLALAVGPVVAPATAAEHDIQLLTINDFHGRIEVTDDNDTPADTSDDTGGAQQLAGALEQFTASNPNTVLVSAGDNIGASTFTSNSQGDVPTMDALSAVPVTVSTVGNHEFDKGYDDIRPGGRVDLETDFPYLGANVYFDGTQTPALQESFVQTIDGVDVGFVGVVTEETPSLVSPDGISGLDFGPAAAAANRVANQLASSGAADVVVLLAHTGSSSTDCADVATQGEFGGLLQAINGNFDAVVSGHTHQEYACEFVAPFTGGFRGPVIQAGQYGDSFGVVNLTYDDVAGVVTTFSAGVEPLVGYPQDTNQEVTDIVTAAAAEAAVIGAEELGVITADITRAFLPDGTTEDRGSESVLGNFVATVQLAQTQTAGAQIALMNPGGLRDDFLVNDQFGSEAPGVVTLGEANAVQPFANGVVTMTLTGQQIKDVLEQQWQPDGSTRPFLALGVSEGFVFSQDASAPRGQRITGASLNGQLLDLSAEYRVTVNSFLAAGGDNFFTLAEGTDRQELGVTDLEVLTAFLAENSPVTADTESNRVAQALGFAGDAGSGGTDDGTGAPDDDQNDGLSIDTGVTGSANQGWVAGGLLLVLAAGGAVALGRREKAVR